MIDSKDKDRVLIFLFSKSMDKNMKRGNLWQAVLAQIELNVSPANFVTWFKDTSILSEDEEGITVSVPNSFVKEWLENKYEREILRILHSIEIKVKKINFVVSKNGLKAKNIRPVSSSSAVEQLRLEVFEKSQDTGLNSRYMFDNFVVGGFNQLAHAAAIAVAQKPGIIYNPLFIYGRVGLGKTHLLQAAGNKVISDKTKKRIKYISAERLISQIIVSIQNGSIEKLKKEYGGIDVLILDDVQFLAGKEKTQEEFFHIFNALYQKNKQIILSSDRSPKSIPAITERLRSRFEGGMTADISLPDLETRIAILRTKSQEKRVGFSDEIYNFLATNIKTNIRELEGALNRIVLYQKTQHKENTTLEQIKPLIKEFTFSRKAKITPKKIIQVVAEFYDLKENDIISSSRRKEIVRPRQIAMYLLRTKLQSSYPFIARRFGGKDHTTAIYAYRKILGELEKSENMRRELNLIKMRFLSVY